MRASVRPNELLSRVRVSSSINPENSSFQHQTMKIKRALIRMFARFLHSVHDIVEAVIARRKISSDFSRVKVMSLLFFFLVEVVSSQKNRLCLLVGLSIWRYFVAASYYLLYVRNSFQSRESRKTLLHFPAALLNSPLCTPRENTHTLCRAWMENAQACLPSRAWLSNIPGRRRALNPFCIVSTFRYNHSIVWSKCCKIIIKLHFTIIIPIKKIDIL